MTQVLILGGTTEARRLCDLLSKRNVAATVSLAGVTATTAKFSLPVRSSGFGGVAGLSQWMNEKETRAVVDATHPFASQMPWNAHAVCRADAIPRLRLLRPAFRRSDATEYAPDLKRALNQIAPGHRVLVTSGRTGTEAMAARTDLHIVLRTIEPVDRLPDHIAALHNRPPFMLADEIALLRDRHIDVLIAKDSGGVTAPKLDAAAKLGIRTILITRPAPPPGPLVQTAEQAVAWLRHMVGIAA